MGSQETIWRHINYHGRWVWEEQTHVISSTMRMYVYLNKFKNWMSIRLIPHCCCSVLFQSSVKNTKKICLYLLLIYKFIIYAEIMSICSSTLWFLAANCKIKAIWNARKCKAFISITFLWSKSETLPVNRTTWNGLKQTKSSFKYHQTTHYYFSGVKQQGTQRLRLFAQQCSHNPQLFSVLSQIKCSQENYLFDEFATQHDRDLHPRIQQRLTSFWQ